MLLILWLRIILYALGLMLVLAWFFTGRKQMILARLAGIIVIIASLLTFYSLMSER
jgi:hypothetical protein